MTFPTDKMCITCTWPFRGYSLVYWCKTGHNYRWLQLKILSLHLTSSLSTIFSASHCSHASLTTVGPAAHLVCSLQGQHVKCSPEETQSGHRNPRSSMVQHCRSALPDTPHNLSQKWTSHKPKQSLNLSDLKSVSGVLFYILLCAGQKPNFGSLKTSFSAQLFLWLSTTASCKPVQTTCSQKEHWFVSKPPSWVSWLCYWYHPHLRKSQKPIFI